MGDLGLAEDGPILRATNPHDSIFTKPGTALLLKSVVAFFDLEGESRIGGDPNPPLQLTASKDRFDEDGKGVRIGKLQVRVGEENRRTTSERDRAPVIRKEIQTVSMPLHDFHSRLQGDEVEQI